MNGAGNGNCPANMIAAIPKTTKGYVCVTPKVEKTWYGTGSKNDSVAVLNAGVAAGECCSWKDVSKMFDSNFNTFSYFGEDISHSNHPNCDCQGNDRFLTIDLRKKSYLKGNRVATISIQNFQRPCSQGINIFYVVQGVVFH